MRVSYGAIEFSFAILLQHKGRVGSPIPSTRTAEVFRHAHRPAPSADRLETEGTPPPADAVRGAGKGSALLPLTHPRQVAMLCLGGISTTTCTGCDIRRISSSTNVFGISSYDLPSPVVETLWRRHEPKIPAGKFTWPGWIAVARLFESGRDLEARSSCQHHQ